MIFRSIKLRGLLKQNKNNPNISMKERAPIIKNIGEREKLWQGRRNAQVKTLSPAVNHDRPTSIPSQRTVFKSAAWLLFKFLFHYYASDTHFTIKH